MQQHTTIPASNAVDPIQKLNEEARAIYLEDVGDDTKGADPSFTIMDENSADWVMNMMLGWRSEVERIKATAETRVNRIERKIDWFKRRFGGDLEQYAIAALSMQKGKGKSILLPCGAKLSFRKVPGNLVLGDDKATMDWAKKHLPMAVVVKEELSKTTINEYFKQTGDMPPGSAWKDETEKFYIDTFK